MEGNTIMVLFRGSVILFIVLSIFLVVFIPLVFALPENYEKQYKPILVYTVTLWLILILIIAILSYKLASYSRFLS